ncbi:hypothetical protein HG535_0B05480 [Zygotorulaspora mrakii]|uniref:Glycosyltransferase family 32 protein n=1 Tax=Zygotorulaspora mrakii TaxID=42260 RepID=A0A7H9AZ71_ZYGMR|nr:uncharacterized protein HG535_0B05480 [Zygotorulaspora mrakii]QLG71506.1 hypothetical protein HG535_0B05480 [Zygotorulaspora mrakii]
MIIPKRSILSFDRRKKQILLLLVCAYTLIVFHFNNKKFDLRFKTSATLPTSSHSSGINLKKYKADRRNLRDLRAQLSYAFPYEPEKPIPRRVWQTWKVGADSAEFPAEFRTFQKDWTASIEEAELFQYSLVPDSYVLPFLQSLYGEVPVIIEAFEAMPSHILKADFLRYLLIYARGGIYSDIDTVPLKPLDSWLSVNPTSLQNFESENTPVPYSNYAKSFKKVDPGFIVGIEADPDRPDWKRWYARRIQFCQWTFQAKPGHPILRELILNITATTLNSVSSCSKKFKKSIDLEHSRDYNVNYRDKRGQDESYDHDALKVSENVDGTDIMNWTGPGIFSDIILNYMSNIINNNDDIMLLNSNLQSSRRTNESTKKFYKKITESLQTHNKMPWEFFSLIEDPVLVDDILVLPITSFSPGVEQMESKPTSDEMAYVEHMFKGTWKDEADNNQQNKE